MIDLNTAGRQAPTRPRPLTVATGPEAFREAIHEILGHAPDSTPPGKLVRFATSDRRGDLSGWARMFDDAEGGAFGCWREGVSEVWQARQPRTDQERREFAEKVKAARELADQERAKEQAECRKRSAAAWAAAAPADPAHPYLKAKGVKPYQARQSGGKLLIPVQDVAGTIHGLQAIDAEGVKRFEPGTAKKGNFCPLGEPKDKTLMICEGVATGATIHEATGQAVAVAFDAGNLRPVAEALRAAYPDWKLIVCSDDDHGTEGNPGFLAAIRAAEAVGGLLANPDFESIECGPKDTDFNDLARLAGMEVVKRCIEDATSKGLLTAPARQLFKTFGEIVAGNSAPSWLVKGILETDSTAAIVGPSGKGKTFIGLDMALSIATGRPWNGREVERGTVVYLCGEGRPGLERRVKAWIRHHEAESADFLLSKATLPLTPENVRAVVASIWEQVGEIPVKLFVVDTLARHLDGEENSAADMGKFLNLADELRQEFTGSSTIVIHHTGHQERDRARGSSAFKAALDAELLVADGLLTCAKAKDAEPFPPMEFKLLPVVVGSDEDGNEITSCAVVWGERSARHKQEALTRNEQLALQALVAASIQAPLEGNGFIGAGEEVWREKFFSLWLDERPGTNSNTIRKALYRIRDKWTVSGEIIEVGTAAYGPAAKHLQNEIIDTINGKDTRDCHATVHD